MKQAGMGHATGLGERRLEHLSGLGRARALGRPPTAQVPQRPCGHVHQRVSAQSGDIEVVGVRGPNLPHGIRVGRVPLGEVIHRFGVLVSRRQRADQLALDCRRPLCQCRRTLRRLVGTTDRGAQIEVVERIPLLVVVRTGGVSQAPMR